jgi:choline dehydrogenase-like flavoprotein
VAVAKDFANLPAWICKTVGGTTTHWAGASLRFHEHEFRARTTYGAIKGANLLDWPLTRRELEPYYTRAEDKMGVTRTHDVPGLPGNNNFKVFYNGAVKVGYKDCNTGHMATTVGLAPTAVLVSSTDSAFRAARAAPSGRRCTRKSRRPRRPASLNCAPNVTRLASSITPKAR